VHGGVVLRTRKCRKIIQIAADNGGWDFNPTVYALCDDGTLWLCAVGAEFDDWSLFPDVPQDDFSDIRVEVKE